MKILTDEECYEIWDKIQADPKGKLKLDAQGMQVMDAIKKRNDKGGIKKHYGWVQGIQK